MTVCGGCDQSPCGCCEGCEELRAEICGLEEVEQRAKWAEETSRNALAEVKRLNDALLHIAIGDWDLTSDEIAIAALAVSGIPWPPAAASSREDGRNG